MEVKGGWPKSTLRNAGVTLIDCVHKTPSAQATGWPYVGIPQVKNGRIDLVSARRISSHDFEEWTRKADPQTNDVVLSRRCNPGETGAVTNDIKFALGQNLVLLRSDGSRVYPPFLRWLLRGSEWWEQVNKFINVGAVFESLKCADVPKFELGIPPLPDQRAIASILGALDDKIELNRQMNATLESLAAAIFKSWFVDFDPVRAKMDGRQPAGMDEETARLFPDSLEHVQGELLPAGWSRGHLGDYIEILDSVRVPLSGRQRKDRQGNYPYYGAASVMDYIDDYLFDGIYLLMGEDGSVIQQDGTPVLQYVWGKFWVNNHAHVLRGCNGFSTEQLLLHLRRSNIAAYVTGAVQLKLNQKNMKQIEVTAPPRDVCDLFAQKAQSLFARLRINTEESRTLASLRDTLLPKLLSGELRVADAERAVEAAV